MPITNLESKLASFKETYVKERGNSISVRSDWQYFVAVLKEIHDNTELDHELDDIWYDGESIAIHFRTIDMCNEGLHGKSNSKFYVSCPSGNASMILQNEYDGSRDSFYDFAHSESIDQIKRDKTDANH